MDLRSAPAENTLHFVFEYQQRRHFHVFQCAKYKLRTQLVPPGQRERPLTCPAEWSSVERGLFEEEKKTLRPDAPSIAEETEPL